MKKKILALLLCVGMAMGNTSVVYANGDSEITHSESVVSADGTEQKAISTINNPEDVITADGEASAPEEPVANDAGSVPETGGEIVPEQPQEIVQGEQQEQPQEEEEDLIIVSNSELSEQIPQEIPEETVSDDAEQNEEVYSVAIMKTEGGEIRFSDKMTLPEQEAITDENIEDLRSFAAGTEIVLDVVSDEGYEVQDIIVEPENVQNWKYGKHMKSQECFFVMPMENVVISASFKDTRESPNETINDLRAKSFQIDADEVTEEEPLLNSTNENNVIAEGYCDEYRRVKYIITGDLDNLVLTIEGNTDNYAPTYAGTTAPWNDYTPYITKVVFKGHKLGKYALAGSTSLKEFVVEPSTEAIVVSEHSFDGCNTLEGVIQISNSEIPNYAFTGCSMLNDVITNSGTDQVNSIGIDAFRNCYKLEHAIKANTIGNRAFQNCQSLTCVDINSTTTIGEEAFNGCEKMETVQKTTSSFYYIGDGAFLNCNSLRSIDLSFAYYIGSRAFEGCSLLESIKLFNGIYHERNGYSITGAYGVRVKSGAFRNCVSLHNCDIPSTINYEYYNNWEYNSSIHESTFEGCYSLSNITIYQESEEKNVLPSVVANSHYALFGLEKIGANAFNGCTSLQSVYFKGSDYKWDNIDILEGNEPLLNADKTYDSIAIRTIALSEKTIRFETVGEQKTVQMSYYPVDATDTTISYVSSDNTVAMTIGSTIISKGVGTCYITAKAVESGASAKCKVIVGNPLYNVNIFTGYPKSSQSPLSGMYHASDIIDLNAVERTNGYMFSNWELTNNPDVTELSFVGGGTVTDASVSVLVPEGGGTIKAKYKPIDVEGVSVSQNEIELEGVGDSASISAHTVPEDALNTTLVYKSDDESIVTVDENGIVTAQKVGSTTIHISTEESAYTTFCTVKVLPLTIGEEDVDVNIADQTYSGVEIFPDISVKLNEIKLVEGIDYTVQFENNIKAGNAEAIILFRGNYAGVINKEFKINKATYNISTIVFEDGHFPYDGTQKSILVSEGLPDGVSVSYINNDQIEVGSYSVIAEFLGDYENYEKIPDLVATLTITKADNAWKVAPKCNDISFGESLDPCAEAAFGNVSFMYKSVFDEEFSTEKPIKAGSYLLKARVEGTENYEGIEEIVSFTIKKANYNANDISFSSNSFVYDGKEKSIEIDGVLPEGVTVTYLGNGQIDAGTYRVTARFVGDPENYEPIDDMIADIIITPADNSWVEEPRCEDIEYGELVEPCAKSLFGKVEYSFGTSPDGDFITEYPENAGTYYLKASVTGTQNYTELERIIPFKIDKTVYDMSKVVFKDASYIYDGLPKGLTIEGSLPEGVTVNYVGNGESSAGEYIVTAKFLGDEINYEKIENLTAKYTINKVDNKWNSEFRCPDIVYGEEPNPVIEAEYGCVNFSYAESESGPFTAEVPAHTGMWYVKASVDETVNYGGLSAVTSFRIGEKSVEELSISPVDDLIYSGVAQYPNIEIHDGEELLVQDKDYSLEYVNNVEAGIGTIIISGINNYFGENSVNFNIQSFDLSDSAMINGIDDVIYNGKEQRPKVTVLSGELELVEGKDYTVDCFNNITAGQAEILVTFRGNYSGSRRQTFVINKATYDLSALKFENKSFIFDGLPKKLEIEGTLPEGVTVTYVGNGEIDAGVYAVTAKLSGDEINYESIENLSAKYTIEKANNRWDSELRCSDIVYGERPNPVIEAEYGRVNFSYAESESGPFTVEVPTHTGVWYVKASIDETDNYGGLSAVTSFRISKKSVEELNISPVNDLLYSGAAQYPNIEIYDGDKLLEQGKDYLAEHYNNINIGVATVAINGIGNYSGETSISFLIKPKSLDEATVSEIEDMMYTGESIRPELTVEIDGVTLEKNIDYTVSYSNNTNIGTATVSITGLGNYTGTINKNFSILPVPVSSIKLNKTAQTIVAGKTAILTATISPSNATNKKVTWSSSNTEVVTVSAKGVVTAKKAGTANITAMAADGSKKSAVCAVTVTQPVTDIKLSKTTQTIVAGKNATLTASVSPSNATNKNVTWTSSNTAVATVSAKGVVTAKKAGSAKITATVADGSGKSAFCTVTVTAAQTPTPTPKPTTTPTPVVNIVPSISYRTHVQGIGWQGYVKDGDMSGTSGQSRRLEAINISLSNLPYNGGITYRTHVQKYGWQEWKADGQMAGTSGEGKRLEAIQIQLTGEMAKHYDVYYQTHIQSFGWSGWASNGEMCGSAGYAKRLEGIRIKLVEKGKPAPGSTVNCFYMKPGSSEPVARTSGALVGYNTHVQTYGWQNYAYDGGMAGTSGESKRLEGIHISLIDKPYSGDIVYRTHVQTYGWQTWKQNGQMSGTSGESKRLEGIQIYLTGEMAKHYDVYYRVHAQTYGWLDYAKNGVMAGTSGLSRRLEGINIVLVPKGGKAPGATARPYVVGPGGKLPDNPYIG